MDFGKVPISSAPSAFVSIADNSGGGGCGGQTDDSRYSVHRLLTSGADSTLADRQVIRKTGSGHQQGISPALLDVIEHASSQLSATTTTNSTAMTTAIHDRSSATPPMLCNDPAATGEKYATYMVAHHPQHVKSESSISMSESDFCAQQHLLAAQYAEAADKNSAFQSPSNGPGDSANTSGAPGGPSSSASSADGLSSTRPFACDQCGKSFQNNSALMKHRLIHSDERAFVCHICNKAFKRQDHLAGHLNVHKSVKPFRCIVNECDKSYCDARSLRRHLEHGHNVPNVTVHSLKGTMYVKCGDGKEVCMPMATGSPSSPTSSGHHRVRNASGDGSHDGSQSGTDMSPASVGIRVPSANGQKNNTPVDCQQCGRTFKNVPALNGHMRLHSSTLIRGGHQHPTEGGESPLLPTVVSESLNTPQQQQQPCTPSPIALGAYRQLYNTTRMPTTSDALAIATSQQQQQLMQQAGLYSPTVSQHMHDHPLLFARDSWSDQIQSHVIGFTDVDGATNSPFANFTAAGHSPQSQLLLSTQHHAALLQQHSSPMSLVHQQQQQQQQHAMHPAAAAVAAAVSSSYAQQQHNSPGVSAMKWRSAVSPAGVTAAGAGSSSLFGTAATPPQPSALPLTLDINLGDNNAISAPATMLNPQSAGGVDPCSPSYHHVIASNQHQQQAASSSANHHQPPQPPQAHAHGMVGVASDPNLSSHALHMGATSQQQQQPQSLQLTATDFADINTSTTQASTAHSHDAFDFPNIHSLQPTISTEHDEDTSALVADAASVVAMDRHPTDPALCSAGAPAPIQSTSTDSQQQQQQQQSQQQQQQSQQQQQQSQQQSWSHERRRHYTAPAPGRNANSTWMVHRGRHRSRGKPDNVLQLLSGSSNKSNNNASFSGVGKRTRNSGKPSSGKPPSGGNCPGTRSRALLRQRSALLPAETSVSPLAEPKVAAAAAASSPPSKHKPPPLSLPSLTLNRYCSQLRSPRLWDRHASQGSTPLQLTPNPSVASSNKVSPTDPTGPSTSGAAFGSSQQQQESSTGSSSFTSNTITAAAAQLPAPLSVTAAMDMQSVPYTPPPILSPVRSARGLYCNINRNLPSHAAFASAHTTNGGLGTPPQSAPLIAGNRTQFWRQQQRRLSGAPPARVQQPVAVDQRARRYTAAVDRPHHWQTANNVLLELDEFGGGTSPVGLSATGDDATGQDTDRSTPVSMQLCVDIEDSTSLPAPSSIVPLDKTLLDSLSLPPPDSELSPPETDPTPHINIGPAYQACVPQWPPAKRARLTPPADYIHNCRADDELIFDPDRLRRVDEHCLKVYMDLACSSAVKGGAQNKELAVLLLHDCRGNVQDAIGRLLSVRQPESDSSAAVCSLVDTDVWTADEVNAYQQALFDCDEKDFASVAERVGSKSTRQCVAFYYTWKQCHSDDYRRLRTHFKRRRCQMQAEYDDSAGHRYNLRSGNAATETEAMLSDAAAVAGGDLEGDGGGGQQVTFPTSLLDDVDSDVMMDATPSFAREPRTVQFSDQPDQASTGRDSRGQFMCPHCDQRFDRVKHLNAHRKLHRRAR